MANRRPIRLLHAVQSLEDGGGIQTWLLQLLRHIDLQRFAVEVVAHRGLDSRCAEAIRALGCSVSRLSSRPRCPLAFARDLRAVFRSDSGYDIVHSSFNIGSGIIMREACLARVPVRIVHSRGARFARWRTLLMRPWMLRYATHLLAISRDAAVALYGDGCLADDRLQIVPSGVDLSPFAQAYDRTQVRADLGIPDGALVVGNVSRLDQGKNHRMLLEIVAELRRQGRHVRVLLVGDGPTRREVERWIDELDLDGLAYLMGVRTDVARLMKAAMDVFVFPSEHEGLSRVVIEAQAAGLPCVMSDVIPSEVDVVTPLLHRISLTRPAREWAELVKTAIRAKQDVDTAACYNAVAQSPVSITHVASQLERLYETAVASVPNPPLST